MEKEAFLEKENPRKHRSTKQVREEGEEPGQQNKEAIAHIENK